MKSIVISDFFVCILHINLSMKFCLATGLTAVIVITKIKYDDNNIQNNII